MALTKKQEGQIDQVRLAIEAAFDALYRTTPGTAKDDPEFFEQQVSEAFKKIKTAKGWIAKLAPSVSE